MMTSSPSSSVPLFNNNDFLPPPPSSPNNNNTANINNNDNNNPSSIAFRSSPRYQSRPMSDRRYHHPTVTQNNHNNNNHHGSSTPVRAYHSSEIDDDSDEYDNRRKLSPSSRLSSSSSSSPSIFSSFFATSPSSSTSDSPMITPNSSPNASPKSQLRRLKRAYMHGARSVRRVCIISLCILGVLFLFNVLLAPSLLQEVSQWWNTHSHPHASHHPSPPTISQFKATTLLQQSLVIKNAQNDHTNIIENGGMSPPMNGEAAPSDNTATAPSSSSSSSSSTPIDPTSSSLVGPPVPGAVFPTPEQSTCSANSNNNDHHNHNKQAQAILKKIAHPKTHKEQCELRYPQMNVSFWQEMILSRKERYFIAANLFNSEKITPDWLLQLTRLISLIGAENIFVSVYESGSDDTTPEWLTLYDAVLTSIGAPHELVSHGNVTKKDYPNSSGSFQRIEFLAAVRNAALEPLYKTERGAFNKVIFINDIFYCAEDILMLLSHQNVDLVSGLDFDDPGFYDTWVARDLTGRPLSKPFPWVVGDDPSRALTNTMEIVPMMCTWNGAVVLNADVFYGGIRFRAGRGKAGECTASECSHLCQDMWDMNFTRIAMDPMIAVAYDHHTYNSIPNQNWFKNTFAHRLRRTQSKYTEKEVAVVTQRLESAKDRVNWLHAQPFLQAPVPYPFEWFCCGLRPSAFPHYWCCSIDEKNMYLPKNCKWERLWIERKKPKYLMTPEDLFPTQIDPTQTQIANYSKTPLVLTRPSSSSSDTILIDLAEGTKTTAKLVTAPHTRQHSTTSPVSPATPSTSATSTSPSSSSSRSSQRAIDPVDAAIESMEFKPFQSRKS